MSARFREFERVLKQVRDDGSKNAAVGLDRHAGGAAIDRQVHPRAAASISPEDSTSASSPGTETRSRF